MSAANCGDPEVLIIETGVEYAIGLEPDAETVVITAGEQGPPGRNGVDGAEISGAGFVRKRTWDHSGRTGPRGRILAETEIAPEAPTNRPGQRQGSWGVAPTTKNDRSAH